MSESPINAVVACVEDDVTVFAAATLQFDKAVGQYRFTDVPLIKAQGREFNPKGEGFDDQGDLIKEELMARLRDFCTELGKPVHAIGLSSFGTIDRKADLIHYISNRNLEVKKVFALDVAKQVESFTEATREAVFIENDASAAALGEYIWGTGGGDDAFAHVWVGRGINVGLILNHDVWHGHQNPELAHYYPSIHELDQNFAGVCAIHGKCLTGLASYWTIESRLADPNLNEGKVTEIIGHYLAQVCLTTMLTTAVHKIAIGGYTVRSDRLSGLITSVRLRFKELLGQYPRYADMADVNDFIVPAKLGIEASTYGMLEIARRKLTLNRLKDASEAM